MQPEEVKQLLESTIENSRVEVDIDGSHFNFVVVSDAFDGMRPVKRQQLVYGALASRIADGSIHAVHMKTFTQSEFAQQN